ncbi:hypothetical protein Heshes_19940 [Alicyclobacillus hesperidum]|uniref:Uncharacterized protein n=1 Tax=Alicyclobacillus hesperidum TaxID=89784 RepID=A0AA37U4L4_9BACL|nr:hypothetical protein Heshes_19940 [Alicyclobacillus hesperidum]
MNRRMRTRLYGGVRGRGLGAPSYSIGNERESSAAEGVYKNKTTNNNLNQTYYGTLPLSCIENTLWVGEGFYLWWSRFLSFI